MVVEYVRKKLIHVYRLLRVPEHINLAWIASEAYILRKAMADLLEMHPNPNPIFQKNVKKDGYF